jgi:3-methyladenine DNA glycosylase AlkC
MPSEDDLAGLNYARIRARARELAIALETEQAIAQALIQLDAPDEEHRMLAVWLLGYTAAARPDNLGVLHARAIPDPSWRVQEALAQAFDTYCAATGYESALPLIDAWLADPHANTRRAVSEGLRPWTARSRAYFAAHPGAAILRLAALRRDPSAYVRHSAGNALRDIRRTHSDLVDAETATWNLADPLESFTYARVLKAQ